MIVARTERSNNNFPASIVSYYEVGCPILPFTSRSVPCPAPAVISFRQETDDGWFSSAIGGSGMLPADLFFLSSGRSPS